MPFQCAKLLWLLLTRYTIEKGFFGAETKCGIKNILGILLIDGYDL